MLFYSTKCIYCALAQKKELRLIKHSFQALNRYWQLLAHYLGPQWLRMLLLTIILCATIGAQVAAPLVASLFIDQATSGAAIGELIMLAGLALVLALVGQGLAVAETYVAENVSWAAKI